jgi:excisionase family DNA binding protein
VPTKSKSLSKDEIRGAFGDAVPQILSPQKLASILGLSVKTVYEWIAKGRLDGAFRKRGNHLLIWRDSAIDLLFNGKDWKHEQRTRSGPRGGERVDDPARQEEDLGS